MVAFRALEELARINPSEIVQLIEDFHGLMSYEFRYTRPIPKRAIGSFVGLGNPGNFLFSYLFILILFAIFFLQTNNGHLFVNSY